MIVRKVLVFFDVEADLVSQKGDNKGYLKEILDILEEKKVSATLNVCGRVVETFPDLFKKFSETHELSSHSYNHENIIELDNENLKKWMAGLDLEATENPEAVQDKFILVKHKDDFFGSCKIHDNKIMNFIPKDRRVYRLNEANKSQDII